MSLDRMPKGEIGADFVAIPATDANPLDVSCVLQVGDNPLDGALRDTNEVSDISHAHLRLPRDAQEDVRMVGEKRPGRRRLSPGSRRNEILCSCDLAAYASCSH